MPNNGSLSFRIILVVIFTILTPPLINLLFFFGAPPQQVRIFSTPWLAKEISGVVEDADFIRAPASNIKLNSVLSPYLDFQLVNEVPTIDVTGKDQRFALFSVALQKELAKELNVKSGDVVVLPQQPHHFFPFPRMQTEFLAVEGENQMDSFNGSMLMPAPPAFQVAVRLDEGKWLITQPRPPGGTYTQFLQMLLVGVSTIALLTFLVWVTSRSLMQPLAALGRGLEGFSESYEAKPVPALGIAEYDRIAKKFNSLQIQIATYLKERMQMIGAISHDLRTPLTRLRLFVEYLTDDEIRKQAIASIDDMQLLIDDTLLYARGMFSHEKRSGADLAVMLMTECDNNVDLGRSAIYEGPSHLSYLCYPIALRRAFSNLIDNGIKYGKSVRVILKTSDIENEVFIIDEGPGIPPEKIAVAISAFERLESSRNRETGGVGLGLTIARDIVLRHAGTLVFRQLEGSGFETRVNLPKTHG